MAYNSDGKRHNKKSRCAGRLLFVLNLSTTYNESLITHIRKTLSADYRSKQQFADYRQFKAVIGNILPDVLEVTFSP